MKKYKIGVIGGSGIYTLRHHKTFAKNIDINHKHNGSSLEKYLINGHKLYFTSRHKPGHILLPHEINYKELIKSFSDLQVDFIISFCTIGSLNKKYKPGDYVIPVDVIDFTNNRTGSKYVLDNKHVEIKPLFESSLVKFIKSSFDGIKMDFNNNGVLGVIEGPRFATHAEQKMFKTFGCDFLNMTQMPEIYLAHVFSIPYISLCHVTDFTAIVDRKYDTRSFPAIEIFKSNTKKVEKILLSVIHCLSKDNPEILYGPKKNIFI